MQNIFDDEKDKIILIEIEELIVKLKKEIFIAKDRFHQISGEIMKEYLETINAQERKILSNRARKLEIIREKLNDVEISAEKIKTGFLMPIYY